MATVQPVVAWTLQLLDRIRVAGTVYVVSGLEFPYPRLPRGQQRVRITGVRADAFDRDTVTAHLTARTWTRGLDTTMALVQRACDTTPPGL